MQHKNSQVLMELELLSLAIHTLQHSSSCTSQDPQRCSHPCSWNPSIAYMAKGILPMWLKLWILRMWQWKKLRKTTSQEGSDTSLLVLRCRSVHAKTQERPLGAQEDPQLTASKEMRPQSYNHIKLNSFSVEWPRNGFFLRVSRG